MQVLPHSSSGCYTRWHCDSSDTDVAAARRTVLLLPLFAGFRGIPEIYLEMSQIVTLFKSWYKSKINFYHVWIGLGTALRVVPRDRPPILIVSGNPGSTTLLGHARVQKPSMRVDCAVCVLQPLTAEHGPAPVTALLYARMFPVYCAGSCCRAETHSTRHHLHHA